MKKSMTNTAIFNINFEGSYDTAKAGNILTSLESILDDSDIVSFEITFIVLCDDGLNVEVLCSTNVDDPAVNVILSSIEAKFSNATIK